MNIPNEEIREMLKENGIYQWQVAKKMGMQDTNFSKLMRDEISEDKKTMIKNIIKEIIEERGGK